MASLDQIIISEHICCAQDGAVAVKTCGNYILLTLFMGFVWQF
jgi:hypothetical protein